MTLSQINERVIRCRRCPRLVRWREEIARQKVRRFADQEYWGRPVPGFGDSRGRLLIIGLAPAAHGANRTGRMFTGDRSGDWLYRALHRAGFANQAESTDRGDGLKLRDCYITAVCRCAPPGNKPTAEEFANCAEFVGGEVGFFLRQWQSTDGGKVILCLGQLAYQHTLKLLESQGFGPFKPRPKFQHGLEIQLTDGIHLLASYHPSQQNTFTGKLTEVMFEEIFLRVRSVLSTFDEHDRTPPPAF